MQIRPYRNKYILQRFVHLSVQRQKELSISVAYVSSAILDLCVCHAPNSNLSCSDLAGRFLAISTAAIV